MGRLLKDKSADELLGEAIEVIHSGRKPDDVKKELIHNEIPEHVAEAIIEKAKEIVKVQNKNGAGGIILLGVVLASVGIVISLASFNSTSGGHFIILGGLIFGGICLIIKGLWRSASS